MPKKIFVCVKQVPDTETRFKLSPDSTQFDLTQVKWIINPYDEFAIEESLKLKTTLTDSQVVAVTVGPKSRAVEGLRTALAMGADEAIVIDSDCTHHNTIAKALAALIQKEQDGVVALAGKLAVDDNASAVPQMLAESLDWNHLTVATKTEWEQQSLTVWREIEGGNQEKVKIQFPLVMSCNKGLNTPRYPSLPGIMKAKKKTIKEISFSDLGLEMTSPRSTLLSLPPERPETKILSGDTQQQVTELVKLLREDAKVL